ncbi:putative hydroxymethylpyrimidine/ phosphomethylpyrimidine kinase 2 [Trichoderma asperellum]|uniref:Putative hydroxymethylpyrimidine/ phosphomethylpyrimidine kinase 2 n=1 Tax=Trichoderma asperellum TaxID=101201 RepID=A0A6V8R2N4_TRIAP|nr:putative hydroxymethylpyrimidine/ phosphomethylpyrimidine kinase 2 [Trichoderma asperellum]
MVQGRVLIIAGSDPSGGAGLEADQKVLAAHGCYAMTSTTALTVQNTKGVTGVHVIPSDFVGRQIEACLEDVGADVIKTVTKFNIPTLVIDPVMVSTSGAQLLPHEAIAQLSQHLLPHTTILTPNIPEATLLLTQNGHEVGEIQSVSDVEAMGRKIQKLGPKWVLVKGGHMPFRKDLTVAKTDEEKETVVDVLVGPEGSVLRVQSPYQKSTSTHGTGCSLASAIAARVSQGADMPTAVRGACRYIEAGIKTAPKLGNGHGPLDHFHSTYTLPFSPGYFVEYLLEHPAVRDVWSEFVYHPFVMALGNGTLPVESFKGYIVQDYLYLVHFSRANALAAYKAKTIGDISRSNEIVAHILHEMKLHINYCNSFGITEPEIQATQELQACTAYTRYVLDIGQSEDWLALQMALAPCLLGYGAVAKMLHAHDDTVRDGNTYWAWIENYNADDYVEAMEIGFWEMFPYK